MQATHPNPGVGYEEEEGGGPSTQPASAAATPDAGSRSRSRSSSAHQYQQGGQQHSLSHPTSRAGSSGSAMSWANSNGAGSGTSAGTGIPDGNEKRASTAPSSRARTPASTSQQFPNPFAALTPTTSSGSQEAGDPTSGGPSTFVPAATIAPAGISPFSEVLPSIPAGGSSASSASATATNSPFGPSLSPPLQPTRMLPPLSQPQMQQTPTPTQTHTQMQQQPYPHTRSRSFSNSRHKASNSHAPRESSIIEMGATPAPAPVPVLQHRASEKALRHQMQMQMQMQSMQDGHEGVVSVDGGGEQPGSVGLMMDAGGGAEGEAALKARRWSADHGGPGAGAAAGGAAGGAKSSTDARRQSGAPSWLDATSNILRSSFSSSSQQASQLPTSMREVTAQNGGRGASAAAYAAQGGGAGYSSASSSPSFGAIRFAGRSGTMSAGPSPSMGPRRYTGLSGMPGPSPPFMPARYTGSAGPSPMSGPVRFTGLVGASTAGVGSIISNASASASGTSVQSYASNSNASSCSSPPPPSVSSFAGGGGGHGSRPEEEWTEYLVQEDGEMRGRQRGLDKALELLRERSASQHAEALARGLNQDELHELLESRAHTPDSATWHDADYYATSKGPAVQAYSVPKKRIGGGSRSSPRSILLYIPLHLARLLRWIARLNVPSLILFFVFVIGSIASITSTIRYVFNPDKEPKPWRLDCAKQPAFPHELADSLAPVDLFVGVFSRDSSAERRSIIRHTYAAHTLPVSPRDGTPMANVQLKFILGRPRGKYLRSVLLEQEMYNDIVILDVEENMNRGKTLEYFTWAAENATVPMVVGDRLSSQDETPSVSGRARNVRWKRADYVIKADDDAFIVLKELERHLRLAPRTMTYWGYLIADRFMAGECYALSSDLVDYVAHSTRVHQGPEGKEDKQVARWLTSHPEADAIRYVSQHCWIYDHPKAGTAYSHGFLFPDHVAEIKNEIRYGIPSAEIGRRGGLRAALSHSTVSKWKVPYKPPHKGMSIEEEVEALVEGGGRWDKNGGSKNMTIIPQYPRDQVVFQPSDPRIRPPGFQPQHALQSHQVGFDRQTGLSIYAWYHEASMHASHPPRKSNEPFHAPTVATKLPLPTSGDADGSAAALRRKRFLGLPHGGTIVVHYVKKHEWFLETAVALLGKEVLRTDGAGGTGSEWAMH